MCVCSGSGAGNTSVSVCVCIVISGNPCVCAWAMKSKHSLDQAVGSFGRRQRRRRNRNIFTKTRRLKKKIGRVVPAAFYKTTQQVPTVEMIERYKKTGSPQGPNYKAYLGKNATPTSHAPFLKGTVRSQLDIQGCVCVCIVISGNPCVCGP